MNNLRTFVLATGGIFLFYAIFMAIVPGFVLSATPATPGLVPLSAQAQRGREIYVGNGCSYCHTQQVRPLAQDRVWGRPSVAGDYAYASPELLGTERTGPDLTNVGARQSDVWEQIHLYEPRALVGASIMPSYRWMFAEKDRAATGDVLVPVPPKFVPAGKVVVTTPDLDALVAYLHALKQVALATPAP